MPPDSTDTKRRILQAARQEFAEFGLAGARIDRIADLAEANKRSIYAHFGPKETLFDLIVTDALAVMAAAVRFDPHDLPGYAERLFDYLLAEPDVIRLATWANLERPSVTAEETSTYRDKIDSLHPRFGHHAADTLALTLGLVTAWFTASPALTSTAPEAVESEILAQRKVLLTAAVAALVDSIG